MEAPMDRQRLLWILVVANILLAGASVGAEGFFGWTLPPALAAYHHARIVESPLANPSVTFQFVVLAALTLCAFAAWIGLLNSWRLARRLYLVCMAMSVFRALISGPMVVTSVGAAFRLMNGLVCGAVLALVYFSDLARRFEDDPAERKAAAGMHLGPGAG
jgi:soluble lytic murein transglycosylase-like protein